MCVQKLWALLNHKTDLPQIVSPQKLNFLAKRFNHSSAIFFTNDKIKVTHDMDRFGKVLVDGKGVDCD